MEADLIQVGLRLRWLCDGTDRLNWRDLQVLIVESGRESAIMRHELGEAFGWNAGEYLLAAALDGINGLLWQNGAGKGQKPKPVERPGNRRPEIEPAPTSDPTSGSNQLFSGDGFEMDAVSIDEMNAWLGLKPVSA